MPSSTVTIPARVLALPAHGFHDAISDGHDRRFPSAGHALAQPVLDRLLVVFSDTGEVFKLVPTRGCNDPAGERVARLGLEHPEFVGRRCATQHSDGGGGDQMYLHGARIDTDWRRSAPQMKGAQGVKRGCAWDAGC